MNIPEWRAFTWTRAAMLGAAAACLAIMLVVPNSPALATSVGVISGTVTDAANNQPLLGVAVSAVSPSGNYNSKTDQHVFYSISGVYADTYSVSFTIEGYEQRIENGVSVFADQISHVNITLSKSPKLLAHIVTRSQASAFQPTLTTTTTTISASQVQNMQGSSLNISETNLLTSLPGAMVDSSGYPVIHGGREYEEGFQFEGIPYVDAYTNQFTNSLAVPTAGVQLVQLTPGAGSASEAGPGTGNFNVVARRGTYPPYAQFQVAIGSPGFDHRVNTDVSWARADGRFSDYASFAGQNSGFQHGNGNTPVVQLNEFFGRGTEVDREFLNNFVYRFGDNNSKSLQFFYDTADHEFYQNAGGIAGLCFASCDPIYDNTWGLGVFGIAPADIATMSTLYPGQNSPFETLAAANQRSPVTYFQPNAAMKLEFTDNISSSTYLSWKAYLQHSVVTFDFPSPAGSFVGDAYNLQGGRTMGSTLSLQRQMNDKNLLTAGVDYSFIHPIDQFRSDSFAFLGALFSPGDIFSTVYGFVPPTGSGCPVPAPWCNYAYSSGATGNLTYPQFDQVSTINRADYSAFVSDKIDFNERFKAEVGLRWDMASYLMPKPGLDPVYCTTSYLPATWTLNPNFNSSKPIGAGNCPMNATYNFGNNVFRPSVVEPRVGLSWQPSASTAVRLTYDRGVAFVPLASVGFGEVDPNFYQQFPFSKLAPLPNPFAPPGTPTACGVQPYPVPCVNFGEQLWTASQNFDGIPFQPALPMTSDNYGLNFQTQFNNGWLNGVAVSIAPWYRLQHNTTAAEASPLLGPNGLPKIINGAIVTLPPVLTNNGKEFASGVDLNITREVRYGISGQLTASYINEFSSVIPTSSSEDFYPTIVPASLLAGNEYRVGFLSPFQATLGLTYRTPSGWRVNPRYSYNIGYPYSLGLTSAAIINGVALNVPNTNALIGSAPNGPPCFVDPNNPGSLFNPNIAACRGNAETSSPGGKLSPPNGFASITVEYAAPHSPLTYGINLDNVFNETFNGPVFNARYQPIATGITGPLTGFSTSGSNYAGFPFSWPQYANFVKGKQTFINIPANPGRAYYFYVQLKTL